MGNKLGVGLSLVVMGEGTCQWVGVEGGALLTSVCIMETDREKSSLS